MPSLPLTPNEEKRVLKQLGLRSVEDLFSSVPPRIRENAGFSLDYGDDYADRGLSEHELRTYFGALAAKNASSQLGYTHFLGGGIYDNIIPALVNQLTLRGEFLTCYTPYQPEISQGTLLAVFEFQTMISRLTSLPVANASMYDGASGTAEAILMAHRLTKMKSAPVYISQLLPPDYHAVVDTFLESYTQKPIRISWDSSGKTDLQALQALIEKEAPYAVVLPFTNYFGNIEPIAEVKRLLPPGVLLVVVVPDPSALSLFEPPGLLGADIVVGEAHQFGTPMLFGGPHCGFFATKKEHIRQMPGRLVGETVDNRGNRAYTLTLSTREQHIRREKATSNICTNQGLIALRTCIGLSFLGKHGFKQMGETHFSLFHYLSEELASHGIKNLFADGNNVQYREAVFQVPHLDARFSNALSRKIIPGIRLRSYFKEPNLSNALLISVHAKHSRSDLDRLVEVLSHD